MSSLLKRCLGLAQAGVVVLAAALYHYDAYYFQPRWQVVEEQLQRATDDERTPSPLLTSLLRVERRPELLAWHATKLALSAVAEAVDDPGMRRSTLAATIWFYWMRARVDEDVYVRIVVSLGYCGASEYGFSKAAQSLFGKPLKSLTELEAATVVAIHSAPRLMLSDPDALQRRRDSLINALHAASRRGQLD